MHDSLNQLHIVFWILGDTNLINSIDLFSKGLRQRSSDLAREIKALEGIEGTTQLAGERQAEAVRLQQLARVLGELARQEDITVWEDCIVKQTKRARRNRDAGRQAGGKAASLTRSTWGPARS